MNFIDITSDDEQEVVLHPTFRNAAIAAGRGLRGMEDGEDEVHPIPVGESSDDGAVACPRCHRRLFIVASSSDEEDNYTEDSLGTGESLGGSEELLPKKRDASGRYHTSRMGGGYHAGPAKRPSFGGILSAARRQHEGGSGAGPSGVRQSLQGPDGTTVDPTSTKGH